MHVQGSGVKETAIQEFEDFVNSGKVNPIEISHAYQHLPTPCLSIFVVYADVEEVEKNAKAAADEAEKKETIPQLG